MRLFGRYTAYIPRASSASTQDARHAGLLLLPLSQAASPEQSFMATTLLVAFFLPDGSFPSRDSSLFPLGVVTCFLPLNMLSTAFAGTPNKMPKLGKCLSSFGPSCSLPLALHPSARSQSHRIRCSCSLEPFFTFKNHSFGSHLLTGGGSRSLLEFHPCLLLHPSQL